MKKFIYLWILLLLASCSTKNDKQVAIGKYITEQSKGAIVKSDFKLFEVVDAVSVKDLTDNWYRLNNADNMPRDSAKANVVKVASDYVRYAQENPEGYLGEAKVWRAKANRIKYLESKNPDDTEFFVIKTQYDIPNPSIYNAKLTVSGVYILSCDMKVMRSLTEEEFKWLSAEVRDSRITNYEYLIDAAK